jgi:hypothetical protein
MRLHAALLMLVLSALSFAPQAHAQAYPVDDSASVVLGSDVRMRWDEAAPRNGRAGWLTGYVSVLVRLDLRPWRGRQARIYQVLAPAPGARVVAEWTSHGVLLPGRVQAGERSLVYAGPITSDELSDTFRITLRADGDYLGRTESLDFSFEIEPEPL